MKGGQYSDEYYQEVVPYMPLLITTDLADTTVTEGEDVTFTIETEGDVVDYTWTITKSDGTTETHTTTTNTYTFNDITTGLNGTKISCIINSEHNETVNSKEVTLTVIPKETEPTEPSYTITSGNNITWAGSGTLIIEGSGDRDKFKYVEIDGKTVDQSNYEVNEDSTIIIFNEAYLKTLSNGQHTVTMYWIDGSASATFTVDKKTSGSGTIVRPPHHSSSTIDKGEELPKTTAECQKAFGSEYIYSDKVGGCIIKQMIIPDTSAK